MTWTDNAASLRVRLDARKPEPRATINAPPETVRRVAELALSVVFPTINAVADQLSAFPLEFQASLLNGSGLFVSCAIRGVIWKLDMKAMRHSIHLSSSGILVGDFESSAADSEFAVAIGTALVKAIERDPETVNTLRMQERLP